MILKQFIFDDEKKNTPFRALDLVRNEINSDDGYNAYREIVDDHQKFFLIGITVLIIITFSFNV